MKINFSDLLITGRGSTALWLILKELCERYTKILVPANICEIIYPVITKSGFTPIFYDVEAETGIATPESIKSSYTGAEEILIVLHQFGLPVKIDEICSWAESKSIYVIEDVCTALGATYNGKLLGTWGNAAIFSFGYSKILEYGRGGAIYVRKKDHFAKLKTAVKKLPVYSVEHERRDKSLQDQIKELRNSNKMSKMLEYEIIYSQYIEWVLYKLNEEDINEISILYQNLEKNLENRLYYANRYRSEIINKNIYHIPEVSGQTYWRYNILVDAKAQISTINELRKRGFLASSWYPPMNKFFDRAYDPSNFSGCESFASKVINLFVDHRVDDAKVSKCINFLNKI